MRFSAKTKQRFWNKVNKRGSTHCQLGTRCWEWIGGYKHEYGTFWWLGKNEAAHRISWMIHFGKIQKGLAVCHHCDNPKCVRPSHLFVGSWADNAHDCYAKGRGVLNQKGEKHPASKISDRVRHVVIPKLRRNGWSVAEIASKVNLSGQNVRVILKQKIK